MKAQTRVFQITMIVVDAAMVVIAYLLAVFCRNWLDHLFQNPFTGTFGDYASLLVVVIPLWTALFIFFDFYSVQRKSFPEEAVGILKTVFAGILLLNSLIFVLKIQDLSRVVILLFGVFACLLLGLEKFVTRRVLQRLRVVGRHSQNALIVGTGPRAARFAGMIADHPEWGLRVVAYVDQEPAMQGKLLHGVPVSGRLADLPRILDREVIDQVFFVAPVEWLPDIEQALRVCQEVGVQATVAMDHFKIRSARLRLMDMHGFPLLTYSTLPSEEAQLVLKRIFDLVVAGALLVLLSPVMLVIAVLIKSTSQGPAIFRQTRVGRHGRLFEMHKFRTMVRGAAERVGELAALNEVDGPVFKIRNDPRVTKVGRFLRRTSLDELPQLLNVVRGEMSLIGPRPPIPAEVERYERWQRRRLSMKPGITGVWQISGRSRLSFSQWMEMDLAYIDNWTFWGDIKIILKTVVAVLSGRGAY